MAFSSSNLEAKNTVATPKRQNLVLFRLIICKALLWKYLSNTEAATKIVDGELLPRTRNTWIIQSKRRVRLSSESSVSPGNEDSSDFTNWGTKSASRAYSRVLLLFFVARKLDARCPPWLTGGLIFSFLLVLSICNALKLTLLIIGRIAWCGKP